MDERRQYLLDLDKIHAVSEYMLIFHLHFIYCLSFYVCNYTNVSGRDILTPFQNGSRSTELTMAPSADFFGAICCGRF